MSGKYISFSDDEAKILQEALCDYVLQMHQLATHRNGLARLNKESDPSASKLDQSIADDVRLKANKASDMLTRLQKGHTGLYEVPQPKGTVQE